jgi:hypothetical protein
MKNRNAKQDLFGGGILVAEERGQGNGEGKNVNTVSALYILV